MRKLILVLCIILIGMSLLLTVVKPAAGICGIVFGIFLIVISRNPKYDYVRKYERFSFDVAGLPYYYENYDDIPTDKGDYVVHLIFEPTNEHDPNAIKVVVDNKHIGYIPAELCLEAKEILTNHEIMSVACYPEELWESAMIIITYRREPKG